MRSLNFMMVGAIAGMAVGAAAMAAANCPKIKRACRTAQRKMSMYARRIGI